MKAVIQRVLNASVEVENNTVSKIENGFLILLGVEHNDTESSAQVLASKVAKLRVFSDENDKMNLSLIDTGYEGSSCVTIYLVCRLQKETDHRFLLLHSQKLPTSYKFL